MSVDPFKKKYGTWALVAGAAEGLGEGYTITLAKSGLNIVMVDNQKEPLAALAQKVELEYDVETIQIHLDLHQPDAPNQLLKKISDIDCRLLIYNAAFSLIKPFVDFTEEELDHFIDINTRTQIKLVHGFAKKLINHKEHGGILLMSSLAGLIGMQLVAPYAATKAFSWNLAEALNHELRPYKIDVTACIAGATTTPTYLKTKPKYGFFKPAVMQAEEVAQAALRQLGKRALFIPGFSNRFNYFLLTRLMPRKMAASIANNTMFKMYRHWLEND